VQFLNNPLIGKPFKEELICFANMVVGRMLGIKPKEMAPGIHQNVVVQEVLTHVRLIGGKMQKA
jgi:hypothetical protein